MLYFQPSLFALYLDKYTFFRTVLMNSSSFVSSTSCSIGGKQEGKSNAENCVWRKTNEIPYREARCDAYKSNSAFNFFPIFLFLSSFICLRRIHHIIFAACQHKIAHYSQWNMYIWISFFVVLSASQIDSAICWREYGFFSTPSAGNLLYIYVLNCQYFYRNMCW